MISRLLGPGFTLLLSAFLLIASVLLSRAAGNDELFGDFYSALILLNVIGISLLALMSAFQIWRLIGQFRARVLGSRLTLRFVGAFAVLALIPLAVVYYFAVQFLSRGIDSWFDVQIEQALDDALLLGRSSLESIKLDVVDQLRDDADNIQRAESNFEVFQLLDELRQANDFEEMSLHSMSGEILASSSRDSISLIPDVPDERVIRQLRQGKVYSEIEPIAGGGLQLRVAIRMAGRQVGEIGRVLQILNPLPLRYSRLAESVESASAEYEKLQYLRRPLTFSFVLTLSLVTLMTLLIALLIAIYLARRLVAPLRDLAEGTQAVAQGDYGKQLPVTSGDELGVLVSSFNRMTQEISSAQTAVRNSQFEAEKQSAYLETVLAHLSAGVMSFDGARQLRTHNAAAERILHTLLGSFVESSIAEMIKALPTIEPLLNMIDQGISDDVSEWQKEISINSPLGQQTLVCSGTKLSGAETESGCVVVFDDATTLIKAQRDAAWGEVARRLAHEIKNPLTPIQLSAERIRRRYLDKVEKDDREILDRATRTITQQVESMKSKRLDINTLIRDITELHIAHLTKIRFLFDLADDLPLVMTDPAGIRQVLNNLIINASDALGDKGGELKLRTRIDPVKDNLLVLELQDNGPGFPAELLDRIFEPYVTTKTSGSGLGLPISRRIIEENSGNMRAANLPKGGAVVIIQLPVTPSQDTSIDERQGKRE
jgi:nitrogen fixation/metabolism regulation signal transduction histidine kinase